MSHTSHDIHYSISAPNPASHLFDVVCTVAQPDTAGQRFFMPAWIPGSYLIRDFARHVVDFSARDENGPVASSKIDKSTWRCAPAKGPLTVSYRVFSLDMSVRGAHLDLSHGFFNGVCVFVSVCGQDDKPVAVTIEPPSGGETWRVATSLRSAGAKPWGFGDYTAADYDELIDHPVEMGAFDVVEFSVAGVAHYVVLSGRHNCNGQRLGEDLTLICNEQVALFGELPDMQRYVFLTRVLGEGYGGLEHRASCALLCRRDDLPDHSATVGKDYRRFLGLVSHEYFHLWNIKRIKPAVFTPFELAAESYTELLWVFEGITSYYDDLALVRSGVLDNNSYFELLSDTVARVLSLPSHACQSLADSSFDAWTKFYQPTPNAQNSVVSYYAKGSLVALALDLTIRERSGDRYSLDDVMRAVWQTYGATGHGMPEDGFERTCAQVTGLDLRPFFDRCVRGTDDIELAQRLAGVGVCLTRPVGEVPRTALGFRLKKDTLNVGAVFNGSAAERAGLSPGDDLVALDGLRVDASNWMSATKVCRPGDRATLHVFRGDELLALNVEFDAAPEREWTLRSDDDASAASVKRRERWLRSNLDG